MIDLPGVAKKFRAITGRHDDADAELEKMRAALGDLAAYQYAAIYGQWGDRGGVELSAVRLRIQRLAAMTAIPLAAPTATIFCSLLMVSLSRHLRTSRSPRPWGVARSPFAADHVMGARASAISMRPASTSKATSPCAREFASPIQSRSRVGWASVLSSIEVQGLCTSTANRSPRAGFCRQSACGFA